jgi:hypothetical protein
MVLANVIFFTFALFTAIGAYLLFAQRSRTAGALAVLAVALFFIGVLRVISSGNP